MRRTLLPLSVALSLSAALLGGCSSAKMSVTATPDAGDLGVGVGGAQDMGYIRDLIEAGGIPTLESWSPEGLFGEHDLPLTGEACAQILCPRAQAAAVPELSRVVVQVGFGTGIDADSFERRDLELGLAVDISGSMSSGGKLDGMKVALRALADRMTEDDVLSLVAFDDEPALRLPPTVMDAAGVALLRAEIDRLEPAGGTNIEAGLDLAYEQVADHTAASGVEQRVLLFTDAQPNMGATGIGSFAELVRTAAEGGVGTTVFGTGLDLGVELAEEMSEVRGGAYVYLEDRAAIEAVFDEDFDYLMTPLAYDLQVQIDAATGWRFVDAVGAPMDDGAGDEGVAGIAFGASTLFLQSGGGGIAVVLGREPDAEGGALPAAGDALARFDLRYEQAEDGVVVEEGLDLAFAGGTAFHSEGLGETSPMADDLGVYKMSLLLDEVDALTAAGMYCEGSMDLVEAQQLTQNAAERLAVVAAELPDAPLAAEAALMEQLARNLREGRQACL